MRIQGERPDQPGVANSAPITERGRSHKSDASSPVPNERTDRVKVSEDARLLNAALKAAADAPETSQTNVERARQKLVSGELGRDAERLADKLIDHLLR